jgi:hypothetical protein
MVAPGNKDGHRYGYAGMKGVVEEQKWGRNTAEKRYGPFQAEPNMKPPDASQPQFRDEQAGDKSFNDHRPDWVRGFGRAENKPGYVPGYKGKK